MAIATSNSSPPNTRMQVSTQIYAHVRGYICTHSRLHVNTHRNVRLHIYTPADMYMYACMNVHTNVLLHARTNSPMPRIYRHNLREHTRAHLHICIHACIYTHKHTSYTFSHISFIPRQRHGGIDTTERPCATFAMGVKFCRQEDAYTQYLKPLKIGTTLTGRLPSCQAINQQRGRHFHVTVISHGCVPIPFKNNLHLQLVVKYLQSPLAITILLVTWK